MRQREHLAARAGPTHPAGETHRRVHELFETEPLRHRRDEQQARVRDQVRVIEGRVDPIEHVRYSRHWKCLLGLVDDAV